MKNTFSDLVRFLYSKGFCVGSTIIRSDGKVETLVYKNDSAYTKYVEWFIHDEDVTFSKQVVVWLESLERKI